MRQFFSVRLIFSLFGRLNSQSNPCNLFSTSNLEAEPLIAIAADENATMMVTQLRGKSSEQTHTFHSPNQLSAHRIFHWISEPIVQFGLILGYVQCSHDRRTHTQEAVKYIFSFHPFWRSAKSQEVKSKRKWSILTNAADFHPALGDWEASGDAGVVVLVVVSFAIENAINFVPRLRGRFSRGATEPKTLTTATLTTTAKSVRFNAITLKCLT